MKFNYLFFLKVFVAIFPDRHNVVRVLLKSKVTQVVLFKRFVSKYIKKILLPLKKTYVDYKIRSKPGWEREHANELWSNAWRESNVYKRDLFLKWSESVSGYLMRSPGQVPFQLSTQKKLCIVGRPGSTHFVEPVLRSLKNDFEIYYQPFYSSEFLESAHVFDYIWFEWGTSGWPMTQLYEAKKKGFLSGTKLFIRVHDFELMRNDVMKFTRWEVADKIIFINRAAQGDFLEKRPDISKSATIFLPNVVNQNSFYLKGGGVNGKFRILVNCIKVSERKGLGHALQLFRDVYKYDKRFSLTIRTTSISAKSELSKLEKKIRRIGLPEGAITLQVDDEEGIVGSSQSVIAFDVATNYSISKMYHNFDIIWSTSTREGFHYAVAEGMLSGLYPVVREWEWGLPKDFWGGYVAGGNEDFVQRTLAFADYSKDEKQELSLVSRRFVVNRFGLEVSRDNLMSNLFSDSFDKVVKQEKKAKRVIFFAHNHLYAESPRGGEHSSAEVLRGLRSQGYECLVVVQNRKSKRLERCTYDDGMPLISLPGEVFRLGVKEIMLWWQPDVAMVWEMPTLDIWEICKSRGIPYIVFVRFWHIVAPPPYIDLLKQKQDPEFLKRRKPVFFNAHTVISNSKNTADVIEYLYQTKSVVSYVPVKKLEIVEVKRKFITLINPDKTMGAESLIYRIALKMPESQFKIYQGDAGNNLSANVVHAPYCNKEYNHIFSDTKLFIFPFEGHPCGTGRVVFECYHLGIPVIGSRSAGLPEIIPNEHLVDSTSNVECWVEKIRSVLNDYSGGVNEVRGIADRFTAESQLKIVYDAVGDACGISRQREIN